MRTIAVVNTKGGVGKTTTAMGLAQSLALEKNNVLVVDIDVQGSASSWAMTANQEGKPLDFPVAQIGAEHRPAAVARLVTEAGQESDWVIIDTSPGDLDRADAAIELAALGGLVLIPTKTSALDLPRALVTIEDVANRAPTAVLLTMARTGTKRLTAAREALTDVGAYVLQTVIPLKERIAAVAEMQGTDLVGLVETHQPLTLELTELLNDLDRNGSRKLEK